jgi:starch phosphorylase
MEIKAKNKEALAKWIEKHNEISVQPTALFDVMMKRVHEYKRQLMCALYIAYRYISIKDMQDRSEVVPRVFIFSGKAAPSYTAAKKIIKLINALPL